MDHADAETSALLALQTSSTQANHQFSSYTQVTNPAINSGGISFFILSFLKTSDDEYNLTCTVLSKIGTRDCM